jgi:hypothetical protein
MTPTELNRLKELADMCDPLPKNAEWQIVDNGVYAAFVDGSYHTTMQFFPSLTGTPEQRLQALDVIVAAFNLSDDPFQITGQTDYQFGQRLYRASFMVKKEGRKLHTDTDHCHDILEAASLALLSGRGRL